MATNHVSDGHRVDNGGHRNHVHKNDGQIHFRPGFHLGNSWCSPKPSVLMGCGILPPYSPPSQPLQHLVLSPVQHHATLTTAPLVFYGSPCSLCCTEIC